MPAYTTTSNRVLPVCNSYDQEGDGMSDKEPKRTPATCSSSSLGARQDADSRACEQLREREPRHTIRIRAVPSDSKYRTAVGCYPAQSCRVFAFDKQLPLPGVARGTCEPIQLAALYGIQQSKSTSRSVQGCVETTFRTACRFRRHRASDRASCCAGSCTSSSRTFLRGVRS